MASLIEPLSTQVPIVDGEGRPTPQFARLLQKLQLSNFLEVSENGVISIAENGLTLDRIEEIATQRVLGRNTAGTGNVEEVTLTQFLDWIGGAAHGDILYRDSSAWDNLAPGTAGQVLQTNGAGADPSWVTPSVGGVWTSVASGTFSGSAVSVTGLAAYNEILIMLNAATTSSSGIRMVTVSTNNGSSYFTSSGNYIHVNADGTTANRSNVEMHTTASTAARTCYAHIVNTEGQRKVIYTATTDHWFVGDTSNDIDAIQMSSTAGNLNGGTYQVLGR